MRNILLIIFMALISQTVVAQRSLGGLGIAYSRGPATSDIDNNKIGGNSISIEAGGFDLDKSPIELSTALIFGNGDEIAFSWELRMAYVVGFSELNFLKIGIGAGEMASYNFIDDLGGLSSYFSNEEESREYGRAIISPYVEWEIDNSEGISFFVRTNWNYFGKSESDYLYDGAVNPEEYEGLFYGGFDASVGLRLGFK
ncbi:MAG: hypothetical protein ABJK11_16080 [Balneola sp.]